MEPGEILDITNEVEPPHQTDGDATRRQRRATTTDVHSTHDIDRTGPSSSGARGKDRDKRDSTAVTTTDDGIGQDDDLRPTRRRISRKQGEPPSTSSSAGGRTEAPDLQPLHDVVREDYFLARDDKEVYIIEADLLHNDGQVEAFKRDEMAYVTNFLRRQRVEVNLKTLSESEKVELNAAKDNEAKAWLKEEVVRLLPPDIAPNREEAVALGGDLEGRRRRPAGEEAQGSTRCSRIPGPEARRARGQQSDDDEEIARPVHPEGCEQGLADLQGRRTEGLSTRATLHS